MIITEEKLLQIILEEIEKLDYEDSLKEIYFQKFTEHGIKKESLRDKTFSWPFFENNIDEGKIEKATVAVGLSFIAALAQMQAADTAERRAFWAAKAAEADAVLNSKDYKTDEMVKQLKNMQAWSWTDDADPRSREAFPNIQFEEAPGQVFSVMPPEYAVFLQVLKDKEDGVMRYGVPDSIEDVKDIANAITKADSEGNTEFRQARINFTKEFDDISLYDTLSSETGIYGAGGQIYLNADGKPTQMQAIIPDFDKLEMYYGGPLPLTGVSVEELYNNYMFGSYFSTEEAEMIEDYLELDIDTELDPDFIDDTNQRAAQDVKNLQTKRNQ